MTRVIVHVVWRPVLDPDISQKARDEEWTRLVGALFERAMALGGRIVGWSQGSIVVDFSWDGLFDAVDFLMDDKLTPELAAGICHGQPTILCDGQRLALVAGEVLRCASNLAELARPGEVLISPVLVDAAAGSLGTLGEAGSRPGRPDVPALILDPLNPLREPTPQSSQNDPFEELPNELRYRSPSSRAPESEIDRQVDRLESVTQALGDAAPAVFPPEIATALRTRDATSLQHLASEVRANQAFESADRLEAIAELVEGKSGDALRRLRLSKEKSRNENTSARCRAALALGVALSAAGRPYEAALEGLDGIARAREGGDERGEVACSRFLSQLALGMGDSASAEAWATLGG